MEMRTIRSLRNLVRTGKQQTETLNMDMNKQTYHPSLAGTVWYIRRQIVSINVKKKFKIHFQSKQPGELNKHDFCR